MRFFKKISLLSFVIGCVAFMGLFTRTSSFASPDLDRLYSFENVSWIKPIDNIDGIFNDFIHNEYKNYFQNQSRFIVKDLTKVDSVLSESTLPYAKLAYDKEVLRKISRQFKVESIIRTKILKLNESYQFTLEWVYAPRGDILSTQSFNFLEDPSAKGIQTTQLPKLIEQALNELIRGLPFLGQITGTQGHTLIINMGRNQGVQTKQILVIDTLKGIKRHPLKNTIEEWEWQNVGTAQVTSVEDSISFAEILTVEPYQEMQRFQKIREIQNAPKEVARPSPEQETQDTLPRNGWIAGNVGLGSYQREVSVANGTQGREGSGLTGVFKVDGLLWLNSRFLAQGHISSSFFNYTPVDTPTQAKIGTKYSGSAVQFRTAVGYSFFPAKTVFDSVGWVHAGYKNTSYILKKSTADLTGSNQFSTLFFGLGGEIPIRGDFSVQLGFDIGLIRSITQASPNFGDTTSSSDLGFGLATTYRISQRTFVRLAFDVDAQSIDFIGGEFVSQKTFTFSPSFMYYF